MRNLVSTANISLLANSLHQHAGLVWRMMAFDRGRGFSQTVRFLEFCVNLVTSGGNISQNQGPPEGPEGARPSPFEVDMESWTWILVYHRNDCEALFDEFKNGNQELAGVSDFNYLKGVSNYEENLKAVFKNSSLDYASRINYQQCQNKTRDAIDLFKPKIEIVELGVNAVTVTNMEESLNDTIKIPELFTNFFKPTSQYQHMVQEVNSICNQWIYEFANEDLDETTRIHRDFVDAKDLKETAAQYLGEVNRTIGAIDDQFFDEISPVVDATQEYLDGNATKGNLVEAFKTIAFVRSLEIIDGINTDLSAAVRNYDSSLRQSEGKLRKGYQDLLHLTLPILNKYNVYELELVKAAAGMDDTEMRGLIQSLESDLENKMIGLVDLIYKRLSDPVRKLRESIVTKVDAVLAKITTMKQNLDTYEATTIMNTDFYM